MSRKPITLSVTCRILGLTLLLCCLASAAYVSPDGAIGRKWQELDAANGPLGQPVNDEEDVNNGDRVQDFERGIIYWSRESGAHFLWGDISYVWWQMGNVASPLGYPVSDDRSAAEGGRFNEFRGGFIYWSPNTGAQPVYGLIGKKWAELGREHSPLGYPVRAERPEGDRRISRFQNGYIYWSQDEGVAVGPQYTFHLENFVIDKTRALHNDDDAISFAVKIGDDTQIKTLMLKGLNDGRHNVDLSIGPLFIGYNHAPIAFNYIIANQGGNDAWEDALREGADALFNEFKERHKNKGGTEGEESPRRADVESETEYSEARADGGASLVVIGATIAYRVLSDFFKGGRCDGPVASDQITVGGGALSQWTDETGEYRNTKFHPGFDSRDGCGGDSKYSVTWSITRE